MVYTSCYTRLKPAMIVIALKCLVYNMAYTGKKLDVNAFSDIFNQFSKAINLECISYVITAVKSYIVVNDYLLMAKLN